MATYTIDPAHSTAHFSVKHMMITNVRGGITSVTGTVTFDPADPANSRIEAVLDATTIDTHEANRDTHLKSADFLDTEQYPTITFKSTKVEADGSDYKATGDLTIHGVTNSVVLNVDEPSPEGKDPWGNTRIGTSASTKIKRSDFGLNWNSALETGGILVGDDLKIEIEISAIKA